MYLCSYYDRNYILNFFLYNIYRVALIMFLLKRLKFYRIIGG